jgi:hypothetical protein
VQKSILILLFFIVSFLGFSQNYPVQTTIQLTAPYTSYLPDYTDGINSKLQIALNITDVNEPILQVKLKFTLEGPGGKIVTNPNFIQSPITLNFGEVLILSGDELSPYLAFDNLVFPSQTFEQNYRQTKVLPEGLWKLCVDVIDATNPSSELLSMNNCALIFVARLQPPMLNIPICETTLPRAQNIFFSWTDMALGSQAIGQEPLYDFSLYSVPLSAYNNPTQVLNTNPIFITTTTVASFSLDTNEVFLPAGQKYLWQVRAKLPDGSRAYLNNGYSAPCTFVFGDLAAEVIDDLSINLTAQGRGPTYGTASWTLSSASGSTQTFESYVISYRKAGNPYYGWYEDAVVGNQFDIKQLEDSTLYEVKIKGIIGESETEYTDIVTFRTLPYLSYACGDGNIRPLSPTYTPLANENAYAGIKVEQGQFFMEVTSIEPNGMGAGRFKGTGKIKVDFLFVSVKVSFDNLLIDSDYTARAGVVNVITQGLDEWLHDQYAQFVEPIYVDGVISSATVTDSIGFVVIDGVTHTYNFDPIDYPIILNDEDGNQVTMFADGTVTIGTYLDVEDEYLGVNKDKVVFFAQNEQEVFGFDAKEHIQWHKNYEIIHCKDTSNYFVANKSIGVGVTDLVDVVFDPAKTSFVTLRQGLTGSPIAATSTVGTKATFTLPAQSQGGKVAFYAFDDEDSLVGKLNVEVYEAITKKVYVVPVANLSYTKAQIEDYLKNTLGEANIAIDVEIRPSFSNSDFSSTTVFGIPDASIMTKYTTQMRQLRNAYIDLNTDLDQDAFYLFIVGNLRDSLTNTFIDGYMARGRSVGFISATGITLNTIAHELGHGIGGLEHSWVNSGPAKGTSTNLMDYTENTNLLKSQWELLRNPGYVNTLWDLEEDASKTSGLVAYYFWNEEVGGTFFTNPESTIHSNIINNEITLAFKRNFIVRLNENFNYTKDFNSLESIKDAVNKVTNTNLTTSYSLYKSAAKKLETVIYYTDYLGKWRSISRPPVVYFDMIPNGTSYTRKYLQCSDSVKLSKFGIKVLANTHYIVRIYRKTNNEIDYYKIFDFAGNEVTNKFINPAPVYPKRYLVFANGYRGPFEDLDVSDGLLTDYDRFKYWREDNINIANKFSERLRPNARYFIDGSFPIITSNHIDMANFTASTSCTPVFYSCLNSNPNEAGFNIRKAQGTKVATILLSTIKADPERANVMDTIDIVAHSMGYAYVLGMMEALKDKVIFGRIYIIAPENACSGGFDWSKVQEVWQYGSNNNEGDPERDLPIFQDGVAPQCPCVGINEIQADKGGRAYIPKNITIPNGKFGQFDGRHSITNYGWIFNNLGEDDKGYVKQR